MRGQVSAIYLFGLNLAGIGIGPTIVAATTSLYGGDAMVSRAIATIVAIFATASTLVLLAALRPYRRAMAAL